ncbi:MAG TPA: hypothetical protein VLD37_04585 [Candidatus Bilamarchaeum sp.]|nr:hypothetical protein [Candidatus Bilamarchaeum sp.]
MSVKSFLALLVMLVFAGCTQPAPQPSKTDALAVWSYQDQGTWDIRYSFWDHDARGWHAPGGVSASIAVDSGDDYDPDVSSNDRTAIAVWSKATGGKSIYYSRWDGSAWSAPSRLSPGDQDTDPAVAMDPGGDALAVWVSDAGESLSYSFYRRGLEWSLPAKINTSGLTRVSLPELAYSVPDGRYYLVFTGNNGSANFAYASGYAPKGWSVPVAVSAGDAALIDFDAPANHRTGIAAAEGRKEITVVWPGPSDELYSARLGGSARAYSSGKMPDVAYDKDDFASGTMQLEGHATQEPDVNAPSGNNPISSLRPDDNRPSLAFLRNRSVGMAVWWNSVLPPSTIYYSYTDKTGAWLGPAPIDPALEGTANRNPALTAFGKIASAPPSCGDGSVSASEACDFGSSCTGGNFCGNDCQCHSQFPGCPDGSLDWPWEQCDSGVQCADPNQYCAMPPCRCLDKPFYRIGCASNTLDSVRSGGNEFEPAIYLCRDDCADADAALSCDPATCTCTGTPLEQNGTSCMLNTIRAVSGGAGAFSQCRDDCKLADISLSCDPATCTCK